jgi:hypothetical protein
MSARLALTQVDAVLLRDPTNATLIAGNIVGDGSTSTGSCLAAIAKAAQLVDLGFCSALGGSRTHNLLIRSQMLYPLSYERWIPRSAGPGQPV